MKKLLLFLLLLLPIKASADESGTCGENLSWHFESATKTLSISGTSAMNNYSGDGAPWYRNYHSEIIKIVIEEGVTTIGNCAFLWLNNLTHIA